MRTWNIRHLLPRMRHRFRAIARGFIAKEAFSLDRILAASPDATLTQVKTRRHEED